MIKRLRRRITILVCAVLIVVTCGIIISINYMNWRNIRTQAEDALETLAENSGSRPVSSGPGKEHMGGAAEVETEPSRQPSKKPSKGQPADDLEDALAALSNYYVITLSESGEMKSWTSDREYLYSEEQVGDMAAVVLETGKKSGRVGTQFFVLTRQNGKNLLIVLDQRLEMQAARRVLRVSSLIAALACLILCLGASILIRFMVKPVQTAFDKQRQFVWDASHELKTPLAVIGANAEALRGEIGENESLGYITEEVRRTNRMLGSLLTLARTDQAAVTVNKEEMDLGETVLSAALPFESSVYDEGKELSLETAEGLKIRADRDMIRQLTVILLSNALKYSDPGTQISVTAARRGRYLEMRVSNFGEGISPEDTQRIFDRFYRADASHSREVEGHGLGLSIAKNIVTLHKGKIAVSSTPVKGGRYQTCFSVLLPE